MAALGSNTEQSLFHIQAESLLCIPSEGKPTRATEKLSPDRLTLKVQMADRDRDRYALKLITSLPKGTLSGCDKWDYQTASLCWLCSDLPQISSHSQVFLIAALCQWLNKVVKWLFFLHKSTLLQTLALPFLSYCLLPRESTSTYSLLFLEVWCFLLKLFPSV